MSVKRENIRQKHWKFDAKRAHPFTNILTLVCFVKFSDAKNEWLKMELNGNYDAYHRGLFAFNMIINLGCIPKQANDIENAIRFSKGFPTLKSSTKRECNTHRFFAILFASIRIVSRVFFYNIFIAPLNPQWRSLRIKWWSRKWACERILHELQTNSSRHINQTNEMCVCVIVCAKCVLSRSKFV